MTDRVTVVPYDPDWPHRLEQERRVLAVVFDDASDAVIEPIGSTAVPGLGAKPVIDIMIGVPVLFEIDKRIQHSKQLAPNTSRTTRSSFPTADTSENRDSGRVCFMCTAWPQEATIGFGTWRFAAIFVRILKRPRPMTA